MFGLAGFSVYNLSKFQDLTSTIVKRNLKIILSAEIIGKLIANMGERDAKIGDWEAKYLSYYFR